MPVRENRFQAGVIKEIRERLPGAMVLKNDPNYIQGIPDLVVLYKDRWAALECKRSKTARKRPNQKRYVNRMNEMSFARFIFPENREEVLNDMERALSAGRKARGAEPQQLPLDIL